MVSYSHICLIWEPLKIEGLDEKQHDLILRRMAKLFASWEHTPYVPGQRMRGAGSFCSAFVASYLCEMEGREPIPLPNVPHDISFHSKRGAKKGLKFFLRQFPHHERVKTKFVQPGDIVVTGPRTGGPGHGILVGPTKNSIWQCSGPGVHMTGFSIPSDYRVFSVYRLTNRDTWLRDRV